MLQRPEAKSEWSKEQIRKAEAYLKTLTGAEQNELQNTILAGLPGTKEVFTIEQFKVHLAGYQSITRQRLKQNLFYFLERIIPVAEEVGIKMCIHPDDPPISILGLSRAVSTERDLAEIVKAVPSPSNGITFCTGSLGADPANDLPGMVERLGQHIHFLHLRNVQHEADGSFHEAEHLGGSVPMSTIMQAIVAEQHRRNQTGQRVDIPMRPDHGHQFSFDSNRNFYPGYSAVGRMRGLAELRGLETGIRHLQNTAVNETGHGINPK